MSEYIDRKKLFEALYDADEISFPGIETIRRFPAEEVAPVRRGDWEDVDVAYEEKVDVASMRCSVCYRWNNRVFFYGNPTDFVNFCPFCGAQMKEPLDGMDDIDIDADDDDEEEDE